MTMAVVTAEPEPQDTRAQRRLAQLSFVLAGLEIVGPGGLRLSRRGIWRWPSLFVLALAAVVVVYAFRGLL